MDIFSLTERVMKMSPESWARHANPWSVYSRIVGGTLVFLSLWSVYWVGWYSVIFIIAAVLWTYLNPRLFAPPEQTTSWATRGVLGERVFLNRNTIQIPVEHVRFGWITAGLSMVFLLVVIVGFMRRDFWLAICAWHAATVAKLWFVDRMVWLWDDMKDKHPTYRAWLAGQWSVQD